MILYNNIINIMNVIQKFEQEYIIKNDKIKFNIENIKPKPKNYDMKNELCNLQYWIHKFDRKYKTFTISKYDVEWLLKAHQLYQLNKKFSNIYEDEINDFIKYYTKLLQEDKNNDKNNDNKYFVRAEGVSLKYGIHGIGPYTSKKQIVESIISTPYYHSCLNENEECKIYLFDWIDNLSYFLEFRIFVFNNKITAISQQHLYKSNTILNTYTTLDFNNLIEKIKNYFENNLKSKLYYLHSYTIDLSFIDEQPYFIEVNPFGAYYAAGSSLFHWINDEKMLCNNNDIIYLRYTS